MNEDQLKNKGVSTHAGFPNAAAGSSAKTLDLTRLLVPHPAATFLMEVDGNTWEDRGIFAGDIIVIDRALDPTKTDLVIWWETEDFLISPLSKVPKSIPIWGVIRSIIHQLRP